MINPHSKKGLCYKFSEHGTCELCEMCIMIAFKGVDPQKVRNIAITKSDGGVINQQICGGARVLTNRELAQVSDCCRD